MPLPKHRVLEHGNQDNSEPPSQPAGAELPPAMRANLLDAALWQDGLTKYARATNLAVALADTAGRLIGECINPRPTWSLLCAKPLPTSPLREDAAGSVGCPFSLAPLNDRRACNCVADALASGGVVVSRDRTGLVHFAVPLVLGEHPLGALVAGQVFDQYPEQLALEQVAKHLGLSPTTVWHLARLEHPVKRVTLEVYADLLATFGQTFLGTCYDTLIESERLAEMTRLRDFAIAETAQRSRVEELQHFLAEVSAEFTSLNYETALKNLARRAVPFLADFCFFDVDTPHEKIQRVAWAHADPAKQELFDEVCRLVPVPNFKDDSAANVLAGQPDFEPEVTDAWMQAAATSPEHLQFMRDLDLSSLVTVPLIVHERRLGALTFCYTAASGRRYTHSELRLAEELAHRAAMVVENAKLYHAVLVQHTAERKRGDDAVAAYERERRITEILQRPLLLKVAEDAFPGLSLATSHVPALEEAAVGGDFYDAFALPSGNVALVIGDVSGKGLEAAAHHAHVQEVVRAFLREHPHQPGRTLSRLNDAVCDMLRGDSLAEQEIFIVLLLLIVDPSAGKAVFASAGAEPPLILRASGKAEEVEVGGMVLGVEKQQRYTEKDVRLEPGDTVLLVTDGVTEARRGSDLLGYEGMAHLAKQAMKERSLYPAGQAILDGAREFAGGSLHDDTCLILVRRR